MAGVSSLHDPLPRPPSKRDTSRAEVPGCTPVDGIAWMLRCSRWVRRVVQIGRTMSFPGVARRCLSLAPRSGGPGHRSCSTPVGASVAVRVALASRRTCQGSNTLTMPDMQLWSKPGCKVHGLRDGVGTTYCGRRPGSPAEIAEGDSAHVTCQSCETWNSSGEVRHRPERTARPVSRPAPMSAPMPAPWSPPPSRPTPVETDSRAGQDQEQAQGLGTPIGVIGVIGVGNSDSTTPTNEDRPRPAVNVPLGGW